MDLGRVDRIAHIVPLAVGNVCDKALGLAKLLADELDDVDVSHLVVAADVVDLTDPALVDDQVDRLAVILDVKPVTDVQALAVDRKRLVVETVGDHQRNQLLREMIRSVVIGAAAYHHRQAVGPMIRKHQQISAGLGA